MSDSPATPNINRRRLRNRQTIANIYSDSSQILQNVSNNNNNNNSNSNNSTLTVDTNVSSSSSTAPLSPAIKNNNNSTKKPLSVQTVDKNNKNNNKNKSSSSAAAAVLSPSSSHGDNNMFGDSALMESDSEQDGGEEHYRFLMSSSAMQEIVDKAHSAALQRAQEYLDNENDLKKVNYLIEMTEKQVANEKLKLLTLSSTQIEEASNALRLIEQSDGLITGLKTCFKSINQIGESNYKLISSYGMIRDVSNTVQNIVKTSETLKGLLGLKDDIEQVDEYLMDDEDSMLQMAHDSILEMEKTRDDIMMEVYNRDSSFDTHFEVFEEYFKRIDDVVERFQNVLWHILEDVESRAQEDPGTIVRVIAIVVAEEERDAEKRSREEVRILKAEDDLDMDEMTYNDDDDDEASSGMYSARLSTKKTTSSVRSRSLSTKKSQRNGEQAQTIRYSNFKQKMYEVLKNTIRFKFEEGLEDCKSMDEKIELIKSYFEDDLCRVTVRDIVPCFPATFDIWKFFVDTYENELVEMVNRMIVKSNKRYNETPMGEKLKMVRFLSSYHELVQDTIDTPRNFTKEAEILVSDFITNRSTFMIQCAVNTVQQDFGDDLKKSISLSANKRGYPCTPTPTEVFTMLNSQVDEIYRNEIDQLIPLLGENCRATLRLFASETVNQIQSRLSELNLVTLCALANNCTRIKYYTRNLSSRILHLFEERHIDQVFVTYDQVVEEFNLLGEKCVGYACDVITKDLGPLYQQLFQKDWVRYLEPAQVQNGDKSDSDSDDDGKKQNVHEESLKQALMVKVVKLLTKYFTENLEQNLLEDEWLPMLTEKIATYCVNQYLDQLLNPNYKSPKFDNPSLAMRQMKFDIRTLKQFFSDPVEIIEGHGDEASQSGSEDESESDSESGSDSDSDTNSSKSGSSDGKGKEELDESLVDPEPRAIKRNRLSETQLKNVFKPLELTCKLILCDDADDVTLALTDLTQNYPDISASVVIRLLKLRSDINKSEYKNMTDVVFNHFERYADRDIASFSLFAKYDSGMNRRMIEASETTEKKAKRKWFRFGRSKKHRASQMRLIESTTPVPAPTQAQNNSEVRASENVPSSSAGQKPKRGEHTQYDSMSLDDFLSL